jgi:hypothetical protein
MEDNNFDVRKEIDEWKAIMEKLDEILSQWK